MISDLYVTRSQSRDLKTGVIRFRLRLRVTGDVSLVCLAALIGQRWHSSVECYQGMCQCLTSMRRNGLLDTTNVTKNELVIMTRRVLSRRRNVFSYMLWSQTPLGV